MKPLRFALIIFISVLLLVTTSACSSKTSKEPVSVAVLLGAHANAKSLNFNNPLLKETITEAIYTYGQVSLIRADGAPDIDAAYDYKIPDQYKSASETKLKADANQKAAILLTEMSLVKANSPEIDLLESLRLGVRALASAPEGRKTIVAMDSGLSTTGVIDFHNSLLNVSPEVIVAELAAKQAIPCFESTKVIFYQLGDTSNPQQDLTPAQRIALKNIWKCIVEAGGGTAEFDDTLPGVDATENLPAVSVINLPEEKPIVFDPAGVTRIDGETIKFEGDTPEFVDSKSAEGTLTPVAEFLRKNPDYKTLLVGTTASGDELVCKNLSNDRANRVRDTLIGLGVNSNQLIAVGMGYSNPWHVNDQNENGSLIEDQAKKNRNVLLLNATLPEAQNILKSR